MYFTDINFVAEYNSDAYSSIHKKVLHVVMFNLFLKHTFARLRPSSKGKIYL